MDDPSPPARPPSDLPGPLRPRERLFSRGAGALTQGELIALVLGSGNRRESATRIASRLVRRHGLDGLAVLTPEAWQSERGLGGAARR